ncbi:MAG: hypothetical protein CMI52_04280 [Parcubacteria group bacterium]|nr:hypothetical protein [Parcubacteria group bacterium]|tara:strand:- start:607 stop:1212 length:606 start_codon:yes stop_codon:yes gene_type:complete
MNNLLKKGIITATAATTAATGFLGTAAFAQEVEAPEVQRASIMERLAERFNLNLDEVKTFFQEIKQKRHDNKQEKRGEKIEERLRTAVANGDLTEEQAQRILAKLQELKSEKEGLRDRLKEMTPEERREYLQSHKDRIQTWAEENGIDAKWLKRAKQRHHKYRKNKQGDRNDRPQFRRNDQRDRQNNQRPQFNFLQNRTQI